MDSVFQELKQAREARRLSITDVADATLINPSLLEAIERGNTTILPQTYIRAFIREYASVVGLDPIAIMQRYDREQTKAVHAEQSLSSAPSHGHDEVKETERTTPPQSKERSTIRAKFALPALLIVVLAIVLWNLTQTKPPLQTNEAPFENTAMKTETDTLVKNSGALPAPSKHASPDSLTLKATMTDSAWVEIIIDNLAPRQYLFRPNRSIVWKARDQFRISTGNAGAVNLTLNEKHLGAAGKRGAVARNLQFNRQTLQK